MLHKSTILIVFLMFGSIQAQAYSANQHDANSYYELGREKYDAGLWQEALRIWMTAITDSTFVDPDPRLGIGFIQLVTEKELTHMYKSASLMYLWSMTGTDVSTFSQAMEVEIHRIKPLLDDNTYKEWREKLKVNDETLFSDIRSFWIAMDPTPMQQPNERLIEHWERISYARKNFTKNSTSVYGTDDRGLIYVRYGKPDRLNSGLLIAEETEMRGKLVELNAMTPNVTATGMETVFAQQQANAMRALYQPTEYEVWIYNMLDRKGTGAFIFGTPGDGGTYGLRKSIDEFIPRQAFRTPIINPGDANYNQMVAGNVLEMGIYRDLAALDPYFAETFGDYERTWGQFTSGAVGAESYKNMTINTHAQTRLRENQNLLRQSRSEYDKKYIPLDNGIAIYRVIDGDIPGYLVVNNTDPSLAASIDTQQMTKSETSRSYALRDALATFDDSWKVLSYAEETPKLSVISNPMTILASNSTFFVPAHLDSVRNLRFSSEFYRLGTEQMFRSEENAVVIGASNIELELPEPLKADVFEVSDIMLIDPMYESPSERSRYRILPRYTINPRGSLGMYFEVYNVPVNVDGNRDYTVKYTISEDRRVLRGGKQRVQISARFRADSEFGSEMLEIDTSKLKSGNYTCRLDFETAEGTIIREFKFSIAN